MKRTFLIGIMIILCLTFGIQSLSQGENMIYGCYKKENGQLRVVTDHNQCLDSELPINLQGSVQQPPSITGEHCWEFDVDGDIIRLGISHIGGDHFLVGGQALLSDPEPQEKPYGFHGNLEYIEGEVHINMTSETDYDEEAGLITVWLSLNSDTLSGAYKTCEIWSDISPNPQNQGIECYTGSVTYIQCP